MGIFLLPSKASKLIALISKSAATVSPTNKRPGAPRHAQKICQPQWPKDGCEPGRRFLARGQGNRSCSKHFSSILKIDKERTHANLSSAIRLRILSYYRERFMRKVEAASRPTDDARQHAPAPTRKARVPRALAMPLTSDRWIQRRYSAHLISVGQFRTADGLVLPGGGALGPQMSRRSLAM
jgi:hypothetical protein